MLSILSKELIGQQNLCLLSKFLRTVKMKRRLRGVGGNSMKCWAWPVGLNLAASATSRCQELYPLLVLVERTCFGGNDYACKEQSYAPVDRHWRQLGAAIRNAEMRNVEG